jgi:hypothetical protein
MKAIVFDEFTVHVKRSHRRKTMALTVSKGQAFVHLPSAIPLALAKVFITQKAPWIKSKLAQQVNRHTVRQFISGESFPFLGTTLTLSVIHTNGRTRVSRQETTLTCETNTAKSTANTVRNALLRWYKQQAITHITKKTQALSQETNLHARSITVKSYRARWGSCTLRGDIQFNWKLIMAPSHIIDYVITHELSHLVHHNHSPNFWQLVATHYPDYPNARKWLKHNGLSLDF